MAQDKQWFVHTLRRLGYTEAAEAAERELPEPFSTDELLPRERHSESIVARFALEFRCDDSLPSSRSC